MSEHTNSMFRIRAAQLHARLEEAATAHQVLTAENAKLREQLAEAMSIIEYIDKHAPLADDTCDEPGITLSEAARRAIADNAD